MIGLTNNRNHFVNIQKDDQIAVKHFKPAGDLSKTMMRSALQNDTAMREPCIQHLTQIHHHRTAICIQNIEVQRNPHFKIGKFEQAFHHHFGFEPTRFWLKNNADVFSRLVTNIG